MKTELVATCPAMPISNHFVNVNKMVDLGCGSHMRSQVVISNLTHDHATMQTSPRRLK